MGATPKVQGQSESRSWEVYKITIVIVNHYIVGKAFTALDVKEKARLVENFNK